MPESGKTKTATWFMLADPPSPTLECSNCKEKVVLSKGEKPLARDEVNLSHCPHCGAAMGNAEEFLKMLPEPEDVSERLRRNDQRAMQLGF